MSCCTKTCPCRIAEFQYEIGRNRKLLHFAAHAVRAEIFFAMCCSENVDRCPRLYSQFMPLLSAPLMPSEAAPSFSDGMKYANCCLQIDAQRFPCLQRIRRRFTSCTPHRFARRAPRKPVLPPVVAAALLASAPASQLAYHTFARHADEQRKTRFRHQIRVNAASVRYCVVRFCRNRNRVECDALRGDACRDAFRRLALSNTAPLTNNILIFRLICMVSGNPAYASGKYPCPSLRASTDRAFCRSTPPHR